MRISVGRCFSIKRPSPSERRQNCNGFRLPMQGKAYVLIGKRLLCYHKLMNKRYTYLPLTLACLSIFVLSGCQASPITTMPSSPPSSSSQPANPSSSPSIPTPTPPQPNAPKPAITEPISDALSRVTKKTFGLYVSPGHSTIRPERFTCYHTGVDFETTPD